MVDDDDSLESLLFLKQLTLERLGVNLVKVVELEKDQFLLMLRNVDF